MPMATNNESTRVLLVGVRPARRGGARYEHPYFVRLTHWLSAISVTVMILSGLQIFRAFPSFGPKIPQVIGRVWPMVRHYFLLGLKPELKEPYNPLQKLAYTSTILFGVVALISGLALYKPVQLSPLLWMLGGFRMARIWHFAAMLGFVSFIPGHLIMVALHGWSNFYSMLVGWRTDKISPHG